MPPEVRPRARAAAAPEAPRAGAPPAPGAPAPERQLVLPGVAIAAPPAVPEDTAKPEETP